MKARIMMIVDGEEYEYGTFPFDTNEQKNKVNGLAETVKNERDCHVYLKEINEREEI